MSLTALFVLAGGFICIVIVLMKQNNHSQFMKLYKYLGPRPWCMRGPSFPHVNVSCLEMKFRLLEKTVVLRVSLRSSGLFPWLESWAVGLLMGGGCDAEAV